MRTQPSPYSSPRTPSDRLAKRFIIWAVAATIAVAGIATLAVRSALAARDSEATKSSGQSVAELPKSSAFQSIRHMTQIISGNVPFSTSKDSAGSSANLGFTGSLQQGFVLTSAVKRYGGLDAGLQLPLPLSFARKHPGPAEIFDYVWAFSTTSVPIGLLHNQTFLDSSVSEDSRLRSGAIGAGMAWRIDSAANGGMGEFRFAWTKGSELIEVNVVGWNLSLSEARAIASRAGS
jgi:hypothetical protein